MKKKRKKGGGKETDKQNKWRSVKVSISLSFPRFVFSGKKKKKRKKKQKERKKERKGKKLDHTITILGYY